MYSNFSRKPVPYMSDNWWLDSLALDPLASAAHFVDGGIHYKAPESGPKQSAPADTSDRVSEASLGAGSFTIDFDDLTGDLTSIPSGYMGMTWSQYWYYLNAETYGGDNGYVNGMTSAPNVAYNAFVEPVTLSSATDFDLNSLQIASAWVDGQEFIFRGYDDGSLVYEVSIFGNTSGPVNADGEYSLTYELNFLSIDELYIESVGGGSQFAIDDMVFNSAPGRIKGRVFNDLDGDGDYEAGESGQGGWTVFLDDNHNGLLDQGESSTTTKPNGIYNFFDVDPGDYHVVVELADWWGQTAPAAAAAGIASTGVPNIISVGSGEFVNNVDFGTQDVSATTGGVSGNVFHDWDGNGANNGEGGLEGWFVFVDGDGDGEYDAGEQYDYTDANGDYLITSLAPGPVTVYVEIPTGGWEGWYQTQPSLPAAAVAESGPQSLSDMTVSERMEMMKALSSGPTITQKGAPEYDLSAAHVEGELIVKLNPQLNAEGLAAVNSLQATMGATTTMATKTMGIEVWKIDGMSLEDALKMLNDNPLVAYAEPNYVHTLAGFENSPDVIPNDSSFSSLYGMHNTGQTGGTPDADIDAPEAWDISTGSSNVVVGVIDTGIDYNHPDLDDNMWMNPGEIAGNGIDDDSNGYIDDIFGFDFINNDSDPWDDHNHGSHVSGTIGGEGNNGIGVAGVNWDVSLMALKIFNAAGNTTSAAILGAVEYSTMMGADLTNNSWGGGAYSQALYDAIGVANSLGQLFIAAAGNHGGNNDASPYYPATYDHDNIISVAATDHNDALASFSGYGATTVDLAAPGVNILSTVSGGGYASFNGTSMATPHVAGVAALIKSVDPSIASLGPDGIAEWKAAILGSVDPIAALSGVVASGGRLNAFNAIDGLDPEPPAGGRSVYIKAGTVKSGKDFGIAGGATPYDDTIEGTAGKDVINGLNGDDIINGNGGADIIDGGGHHDTINGGNGADIIRGGWGQDTLNGNGGTDELYGDSGNDTLIGSAGADLMDGGDGGGDTADYSDSGSAISVVLDGFGIGGDAAGDTLLNIENLIGTDFGDILVGNGVQNTIDGGKGADILIGLGGHDNLFGGVAKDTLFGGGGNDLLDGGLGDDTSTGGTGGDTFLQQDKSGDDVITDFNYAEGDRIWVDSPDVSAYYQLTKGNDGNGNAMISWTHDGTTQSVILLGVTPGTVKKAWFNFGPHPSGISSDDDDGGAGNLSFFSEEGSSVLAASTSELGRTIYKPHDGTISKVAFDSSMPVHPSVRDGIPDYDNFGGDHEYHDWHDTTVSIAWMEDTIFIA